MISDRDWRTRSSYGLRPGEETAVNSIDDRCGADLTPAKESAIQAFDGVFSALDTIEF